MNQVQIELLFKDNGFTKVRINGTSIGEIEDPDRTSFNFFKKLFATLRINHVITLKK